LYTLQTVQRTRNTLQVVKLYVALKLLKWYFSKI